MDGVMGVMSERFPPANHRGFARKPMFGLVQGSGLVRGRGCFQLNAARYWFCERSVCTGMPGVRALTKTMVSRALPAVARVGFLRLHLTVLYQTPDNAPELRLLVGRSLVAGLAADILDAAPCWMCTPYTQGGCARHDPPTQPHWAASVELHASFHHSKWCRATEGQQAY